MENLIDRLRGAKTTLGHSLCFGLVAEAADELQRLRDENARLQSENWKSRAEIAERALADLGVTPAEARAGVERSKASQQDAARYRWLKACNGGSNGGSIGITTFNTDEALERVLVEDDADTMIDAAMRKGE